MLEKLQDIKLNTRIYFPIGKYHISIYPFDWQFKYTREDWTVGVIPPCIYHSFLCVAITINQ